jgi:hypothetical protein
MLWQLAVSLDVDLKYVENSIPIINTCKMRMKWGKNLKKYMISTRYPQKSTKFSTKCG